MAQFSVICMWVLMVIVTITGFCSEWYCNPAAITPPTKPPHLSSFCFFPLGLVFQPLKVYPYHFSLPNRIPWRIWWTSSVSTRVQSRCDGLDLTTSWPMTRKNWTPPHASWRLWEMRFLCSRMPWEVRPGSALALGSRIHILKRQFLAWIQLLALFFLS